MPGTSVVGGSVRKVCQLTGERDRQRGTPPTTGPRPGSASSAPTSAPPSSTPAGSGSSSATPGPTPRAATASRGRPTALPSRASGCTSPRPAPGSSCPRVSTLRRGRVSTRAFEVPTAGFSANGHMYVIRTTEHYREAGREVMGRSVLTRAVNGDPTDLACLYDLSVVRRAGSSSTCRASSWTAAWPGCRSAGRPCSRGGAGATGRATRTWPPSRSGPSRTGAPGGTTAAPTARGGRTGASTSATPSRCSRIRRSASCRSPGTRRWACG